MASKALVALLALELAGCASFDGRGLAPGQSTAADVERVMGAPAEKRQVGAETWYFYPRQPYGRAMYVARVGSDGRLAALEQRLTDGNYRVRFVRDVSQCTWSGTPATDGASLPDAFSVRIALDLTEPTKSQLVVRTNDAAGNPKDSGFHVQVFC